MCSIPMGRLCNSVSETALIVGHTTLHPLERPVFLIKKDI